MIDNFHLTHKTDVLWLDEMFCLAGLRADINSVSDCTFVGVQNSLYLNLCVFVFV